ncbi:MAG: amino acid adenylation domain-containing protein [Oscillospiraceae bacterium]|nr:amino acid adenylation domain-containing protein [Oscillospiraceae bacterium]
MDLSVLKWLDKTAALFPEKVVFSDKVQELTFSQLDGYAKSIGTYLANRLKVNSPVAVMSGRHVMTPACYLGVVRAGCFYAPMDATMPQTRLNQILNVIRADILLVDREFEFLARNLAFDGEIVVMEDILQTPVQEELLQKRAQWITATTPLYVIFTSGSTGVPKGVITSHGSLMCYIDAVCKVLQMDSDDVLGNQSPLDYIAAVRDIYIPVKLGASTVILPKNEFSMPAKLFETLNEYRVTTICWSVAGVELPAKLGAFDLLKPEYVKKVCFSGSVMPCKYLKIWQTYLPDALYVNQYGPTEATASCTYYVVREKVEDTTVLPIGIPYENYQILLLNEDHTETQMGEVGEICVSGPVLALGYYGNPEKTAEAFIQNPLNPNYRELIYKTGDLGRYREDGVLEFHGRKDRQIKHMGHRIELGEIEGTALEIPGVAECCALYQKEKELLYLFYSGEATAKEIALHFRKVLPAFMVPRKTVNLPAIPKLPNGKLDMQTMKTYFK